MVIAVGASFKAELNRVSGAEPVILLAFNFTTGHRRFACWPADVIYDGNTYEGLGPIGEIDTMQQSEDGALTELFFQFFVTNAPDLLADIQQNSRGRTCSGYLVFLGADGLPVGGEAMFLWFRTMVPGRSVSSATTYMAEIGTESRFHRHRLRAARTYSHAEQQRRDPTDQAFRDVGKIQDLTRRRYTQRSGLTG